MRSFQPPARRPGQTVRWLAVAAGALLLASCRSISLTAPVSALAPLPAVAVTSADAVDAVDAVPLLPVESPTAAAEPSERSFALPTIRDGDVQPTGLDLPSPPLPRLGPAGPAAAFPVAAVAGGRCQGPDCQPHAGMGSPRGGCGSPRCRLHACRILTPHAAAGCQGGECQAGCGTPIVPTIALPVIGPCLVCDGGDHGKPAVPRGRTRLGNITSGDTVARYRADGPGPAPEDEACLEAESCVVASNCTCVYAPRFSSVRRVIRPFEDAVPTGPKGLALDTIAAAGSVGQSVYDKTQQIQIVAARLAQQGIAVEDRIPVLAVDKVVPPVLQEGVDGPVAVALDLPVEKVDNVQAPRLARKIDVPLAWMCVSGAQVTVNGEAADVLAVDHGVATLRLESPGRCELTLCKRAGSDTARPGEELDFTIFVLNSGDRPLTDITLVDAVPGRLAVIEGSPVSNLPAAISTSKGDDGATLLSWTFKGTLAPGQGCFVRFRTIVH
jgi:uncharacterized repeat protein (TIGR01451 family)